MSGCRLQPEAPILPGGRWERVCAVIARLAHVLGSGLVRERLAMGYVRPHFHVGCATDASTLGCLRVLFDECSPADGLQGVLYWLVVG